MATPKSPYWLCQGGVFLLGLSCACSIAYSKGWLPAPPKMWRVVAGTTLIGVALFLSQVIVYRFLGLRETLTGYSLHYFLGVSLTAFGLFVYTNHWRLTSFIGLMFSEIISFLLPAVVDKFFYLEAWQYDGLYFSLRNAFLSYICTTWLCCGPRHSVHAIRRQLFRTDT